MDPMCTQSVLQSHGNFIVSVGRVVGRASVMIKAQEAATEGTHVAVPEGLVPAMTTVTVMAEFYCNPPYTYCSIDLHSLTLTIFLCSLSLSSRLYMQKLRHEEIKELAQGQVTASKTWSQDPSPQRDFHLQDGRTGNPESAGGQALAVSWLGRGQAGQKACGHSPEAIQGVD